MLFLPFHNILFSFLISYTSNAIIDMVDRWRFYFRGKKRPKMCLNISWSIKMPCKKCLVLGVSRSGLWAPGKVEYVARVSETNIDRFTAMGG